jgi:DMSO/TMAO reductase YedYZ heme-binding membrane subunit
MPSVHRHRGVFGPDTLPGRPPRTARLVGVGLSGVLLRPGLVPGGAGVAERIGNALIGFLDFYSGVFSLVSVSLAMMCGVLAMDRIVLQPRHRVQAQLVHRAVAMASVGFLVVHVALRVVEGHIGLIDVAVPFMAGGRTFFVGLGTVAAMLMVVLAATGVVRSRFAYGARPSLWRAIHATAYLCWPVALVHGLRAGRTPAPWVTTSYQACVALVALALLIRMITSRRRRARGRRDGRTTREVRVPEQGGVRMRPVGAPARVPSNAAAPGPPRPAAARPAAARPAPARPVDPPRVSGPSRVPGALPVPGPLTRSGTQPGSGRPPRSGTQQIPLPAGPRRMPGSERVAGPLPPDPVPTPVSPEGIISDDDFWTFLRSPEPDGNRPPRR